jgi:Primosomal protein N'' (replication factor Y) - superfamily II helicase
MKYAEIAVDFPDNSQRAYTYKIPNDLLIEIGDLVWVPFGSRTLCGIVLNLTTKHNIDEEIIKNIISKINDGPYFDESKLKLIRYISDYYRTSFFSTASLFLPPNAFSKIITIIKHSNDEKIIHYNLSDIEKKLLQIVEKNKNITKKQLVKKVGLPGKTLVDKMIKRDLLISENIWEKPKIGPVYHNRIILGISKTKATQIVQKLDTKKNKHKKLINWFIDENHSDTKTFLRKKFGYSATEWVF